MLKETRNIADKNNLRSKDDYFDIIVWYDTDRRVSGFQLCCDMQGIESALTWVKG